MVNRYIVVPLLVWAIAQFLKFALAAFRGHVDFRYLYGSGGMPSVHAAVVTSLAVTAFLVDGVNSPIFGLSAIFAAIVMYDSFGVRRSAGEQAVAINAILDSLDRDRIDHPRMRLREILGHKPLEVSVGAVLGLLLGGILNSDRLTPFVNFITLQASRRLAIVVAIVAALIFLAAIFIRWTIFRVYRKAIPAVKSALRTSGWSLFLLAALGLIIAFLEYERVTIATWILWPILYLILVIIVKFTLFWRYRQQVPQAISIFEASQDKAQWLEGPNKKRRAKKAARASRRR